VAGRRASYDGVAVAVPVTVPYVRYSIRGAHWFAGRALAGLVAISGIDKAQIDGLCFSSFTLAPDTAVGLSQHLGLAPRWLDNIPLGGASGIVALRRAARAVQAGDAAIVACIAADTNQPDTFRRTSASFSVFARDAVYPYGAGGANASFALLTAYYMRCYGARAEDFGKICVAQRANAASFPLALLRKTLTLEDYLAARPIAEPLRLFDCVMPCAGAEALLVMREDVAAAHGLAYATIRAAIERHNAFADDPVQMRGGWAQDRDELYAQAGLGPAAIDFLETYDDYPVMTMMQIEDLGFCAKGAGPDFVRAHDLTVEGSFPLNTSGGQLSVGQAGAGGAYLGLTEAVRQLTGAPLGRAVAAARVGMVSGFGMINYDRGLCSGAVILARGAGA
jgi:acetyl-CoA acetyltransferase